MQRHWKILSIAQDPDLLLTRQLLFKSEGYYVHSTDSVQEAIRFATITKPDLVVVGHSLGDGQRRECVSKIREAVPCPILVLNRMNEKPYAGVENSASHDPAELLKVIREILDKYASKKKH